MHTTMICHGDGDSSWVLEDFYGKKHDRLRKMRGNRGAVEDDC